VTTLLALAWVGLAAAWVLARRESARPLPFPPRSDRRRPSTPLQPLARRVAGWREPRRQRAAVAAAVPDLVDLFAVAFASGLNVRLATFAVAERAPPGPVRDALRAVTAGVDAGERLADALERVPSVVGHDAVRPLIGALVDAERYGTALGPTLDRLAADARRARQRRAEEVARRLPVQLLFPLVTCILPAFGLLTVAPLIAGGLRALRP
jgi:tight adherence protein C